MAHALIVDDDADVVDWLQEVARMEGFTVARAHSLRDARIELGRQRPDVLLTDLAMPGEDGFALMRRVRAMPAPLGTIPAVALTAYTDTQSVQHAFAAGFDAHLGKPLEPHVLADALVKVLRTRRGSG